jgi:hypothetical protein
VVVQAGECIDAGAAGEFPLDGAMLEHDAQGVDRGAEQGKLVAVPNAAAGLAPGEDPWPAFEAGGGGAEDGVMPAGAAQRDRAGDAFGEACGGEIGQAGRRAADFIQQRIVALSAERAQGFFAFEDHHPVGVEGDGQRLQRARHHARGHHFAAHFPKNIVEQFGAAQGAGHGGFGGVAVCQVLGGAARADQRAGRVMQGVDRDAHPAGGAVWPAEPDALGTQGLFAAKGVEAGDARLGQQAVAGAAEQLLGQPAERLGGRDEGEAALAVGFKGEIGGKADELLPALAVCCL